MVKKLEHYIDEHGLNNTASALGVTPQRLFNWIERGVPLEQCTGIELATNGAVMRWDLRPTDWHSIWPELSKRPDAPAREVA